MLTELECCYLMGRAAPRIMLLRQRVKDSEGTFGAHAVFLNKNMDCNHGSFVRGICFGALPDRVEDCQTKPHYLLVAVPNEVYKVPKDAVSSFYKWVEKESSFSSIVKFTKGNKFAMVTLEGVPEVEVRSALILVRAMTELSTISRDVYSEAYSATGSVPFSLLLAHCVFSKCGTIRPKIMGDSHLLISPRETYPPALTKHLFKGKRLDLSSVPEICVHPVHEGRMDRVRGVSLFCQGLPYRDEYLCVKEGVAAFLDKKANLEKKPSSIGPIEIKTLPDTRTAAKYLMEYLGEHAPEVTWEGETV